ncbi:MAG: hypothetical protein GX089_14810 [Fibrobacter sp.]|nr:hypothetical protein [Fibrobacter sp.]HON09912.1 hypothetical protein [Chitinispirillaceae bacterium]
MIQIFILLLGISIGHSVLLLKIRKEENRKRELELALLEKRANVLEQGKKVAHDIEEALYQAKIQQEIDDIIKKSDSH